MPRRRSILIRSPVGGLNRQYDFQSQPPYTTPDCANVRPAGVIDGRERTARRPGLSKYSTTQLGASGARDVRMIGNVSSNEASGDMVYTQPRDSSGTILFDDFSTQGAYTPSGSTGLALHHSTQADFYAYHAAPVGIVGTEAIMLVSQFGGATHPIMPSGDAALYIGLSSLGDMTAGGTLVRLFFQKTYGLSPTLYLQKCVAGAWTDIDSVVVALDYYPCTLTLIVSGTNVLASFEDWAHGLTYLTSAAGPVLTSFGFGQSMNGRKTDPVNGISLSPLVLSYTGASYVASRRVLIPACGQKVYSQSTPEDTIQQITTGARTVALKHLLRCAEMFGKLYVADHTVSRLPNTTVSDGVVASSTQLTSATIGDWAAIGAAAEDTAIDAASDLATLTKGDYQYQCAIASIATVTLNLSSAQLTPPNDTGYTVRIERGPKVIDPVAGTITNLVASAKSSTVVAGTTGTTLVAAAAIFTKSMIGYTLHFPATGNAYVIASYTSTTQVTLVTSLSADDDDVGDYFFWTRGVVPTNCSLIAEMWNRLVLAGDGTAAFYCSAVGDPTDWLYGDTTKGSDAAFGGASEVRARIGAIPTALCPFGEGNLIIGCADSLWGIRGDPGGGGTIVNLSRIVGIIGGSAWCSTPDGHLIFVSRDGIYILPPGAIFTSGDSSVAVPFSNRPLPAEFKQIDPNNYDVQLQYDIAAEGAHVFVTPRAAGTGQHWFLSWKNKSFSPASMVADHGPTAAGVDAIGNVLMGGRDGYLRKWDKAMDTDDGESITGSCLIGPIQCGRPGLDGAVQDVVATLPASSSDVDWSLKTGKTVEEALYADAVRSGTWVAGRNRPKLVRARGAVAFLQLSGSGRWEFETAEMILDELGKLRF